MFPDEYNVSTSEVKTSEKFLPPQTFYKQDIHVEISGFPARQTNGSTMKHLQILRQHLQHARECEHVGIKQCALTFLE